MTIIGIDLGTTNSVVAAYIDGQYKIIHNRENELATRSIVSIRKGEFLVGTSAYNYWQVQPKDTIISIKRLMGRSYSDEISQKVKAKYDYIIVKPSRGTSDSICVLLDNKEFTPIEISSIILKKLKADAEYVLNKEITHAVITVPAYFSDKQRFATREAGRLAGLNVVKILSEPTAAAIATMNFDQFAQDAKTVLVYDLGGGTFDVSVLVLGAGHNFEVNLEGNMFLGGDDFDQIIVDKAVEAIKSQHHINPLENNEFMVELKKFAQKAKETLSNYNSADIITPSILKDYSGNPIAFQMEISRDEYEQAISHLINDTISLTKKAIEGAGLLPDNIDNVIIAGNASAIPKIEEALVDLFGKEKILRKGHPKQIVALGAAMVGMNYLINCPGCNCQMSLTDNICPNCGIKVIICPICEKIRSADIKTCPNCPKTKICPVCDFENDQNADVCSKCGYEFSNKSQKCGHDGIAAFPYGIQTAGNKFEIFIQKGEGYCTCPEKRITKEFITSQDGQWKLYIPVYGGENLEKATNNEKQGEAIVFLNRDYDKGTPVFLSLWLDSDGSFEISAHLGDGLILPAYILRGDMGQQIIEEDFKKIEALYANEKNTLDFNKTDKIIQLREDISEKMKNQDYDGAKRKIDEIEEILQNPIIDEISSHNYFIGLTSYLLQKYYWIIESNLVSELTNLVTQYFHNRNNHPEELDAIVERVRILLEKTLQGNIMLFLNIEIKLEETEKIRPDGLIFAEPYHNTFEKSKELYKNGNQEESLTLLQEINSKLEQFIKNHNRYRQCLNPECLFKENPLSTNLCIKCGHPLDLVKDTHFLHFPSTKFDER